MGRVKTRLAKTVGDRKAFQVYKNLLAYTRSVVQEVSADKAVFYSDHVDENDLFDNAIFQKYQQAEGELGSKMACAFQWAFLQGYERVVIIGSDCVELTPGILEEAFRKLKENHAVLGPARDGGYYLLGMDRYINLFRNKEWSSENVLLDTLLELKDHGYSYALLQPLSDLDDIQDLYRLREHYADRLS